MCRLDLFASFYIFIHLFIYAVCDDSGATIVWKPNDPNADADVLRRAMKGLGTTEADLIKILAGRTGAQRQAITAAYSQKFQRSLAADIQGDTSGTFEDILVDLTYSVEEFLAKEIFWSLGKDNEWAYIDIICTCDPKQMQAIKAVYLQIFKVTLASDIEQKVSFIPTRMLLLRILSSLDLPYRSTDDFNEKAVKSYVDSIPDKKENCMVELNGLFFTLMSKESFREIQTVVRRHNEKHKDHPVTARIDEYCDNKSLQEAYKTIALYSDDPVKYFAVALQAAMKGLGTDERDLNRIIIWRSEIDLNRIMAAFFDLTHKSLEDCVKSDSSGDYEKTLVKLIQGNEK